MASVKALLMERDKKSDGSWPLKIRVTQNRKSKYVKTDVVFSKSDFYGSGKLRPSAEARMLRVEADMKEKLEGIPKAFLEKAGVDEIAARLGLDRRGTDFIPFYRDWVEKRVTPESRRMADCAVSALLRYTGGKSFDGSRVDSAFVQDFVDFLYAETDGDAPGVKVKCVRIIALYVSYFKRAWTEMADRFHYEWDPFSRVRYPKRVSPSHSQRALTAEEIQKVIDWVPQGFAATVAKAVLLLSFCLCGTNIADLYEVAPPAITPQGRILKFRRKKTRSRRKDGAYIEMRVPEEAAWALAVLECSPEEVARTGRWLRLSSWYMADRVVSNLCNGIIRRDLTILLGCKVFSAYSFRHGAATALRRHTDMATVAECLNHVSPFPVTDRYVEKDFSRIWKVNAEMLSDFTWPSRKDVSETKRRFAALTKRKAKKHKGRAEKKAKKMTEKESGE